MLSAALALTAINLLLPWDSSGKRVPAGQVVLAAAAAALAMLAHPGAAFTLAAFGLFLLLPRYFPGGSACTLAIAVILVLLVPWWAYGHFYDPPANRLVKWHLAGFKEVDERTTVRTIADSYAAVGWRGALANKAANLGVLVGQPFVEPGVDVPTFTGWWRNQEYWHVIKTCGVLNAGWIVFLIALIRPKWFADQRFLGAARFLLALALVSLILWVLLLFGPATTVVIHGSFTTMLLLFVGLAIQLLALPPRWIGLLLVCQIADFVVIWLLSRPAGAGVNAVMLPTALLALGFLVLGAMSVARSDGLGNQIAVQNAVQITHPPPACVR